MAEQTRETLRKYFDTGRMPTAEHFSDLVDSMLNMKDEGFRRTAEHGLHLSPATDEHALLSFFTQHDPDRPSWVLRHGKPDNLLRVEHGHVSPGEDRRAPVLCLHQPPAGAGAEQPPARVGVNIAAPQHALDVAGVAGMHGRVGRYARGVAPALPADGEFHALIDGLTGCHAFEVVASVGLPNTGRYALLHAVVLNTFNPAVPWWRRLWPGSRSRGIRATSMHYGKRSNRLQLRWEGTHGRDARYRLCIRTGSDYGQDPAGNAVQIRCSVTQLWFDPSFTNPAPGQ